VPGPSLGSTPSLAAGSSLCSSPPRELSTTPLRGCTTRMPASAAGSAAASQSRQTPAIKDFPGGPDSSTCCSPVSPYQPTGEAETSVAGSGLSLASTPARARVPGIRLDLISAL